ncbi:MAG: diacylglycerol O-acyltransferase / wax synthase [Solirubrobacteraceae bacterium]|nr:diacylglycerol O-acyltransferase / wax synthase [Solirubrobacteraceae bacterium]
MSQLHLDRLRATDASFLLQEGPTTHAHVGGVATFGGPPPAIDEIREQIRGRLDLVPRYRQRLAYTALDRARPVWVDDTRFDLEYHVRHTALPAPGDREVLQSEVARVYSEPLDRSRPLWETWLVEGLEDDGFALIFKTHHALIDGTAAVDLLKILFDPTPDATPSAGPLVPWQPQPTPDTLGLLAFGARGAASAAVELAAGTLHAARDPQGTVRRLLDVAEGFTGLAREFLRTPPKTPLTSEVGRHRRFVAVPCRLDDVKLVKNTLGGTINDVVLSVVTGAVREFLLGRGVPTDGLELSALVPVSVRAEHERNRMGNRIAVLRGSLPVHVADPLARLRVVTHAMDELKGSKQAPATEFVLDAQDFLPPVMLPITSRVQVSPRMFNVIVTNFAGPQVPLYVLGREMRELTPIALLQPAHTLAIAIMSYNGQLNFGVLGDYDAMPDLHVVSDAIAAGMAELVALCGDHEGATPIAAPAARDARRASA